MSTQSQNCEAKDICCQAMAISTRFRWQPNHMTAATDTHATIEELLDAMFFIGSMSRLYTRN